MKLILLWLALLIQMDSVIQRIYKICIEKFNGNNLVVGYRNPRKDNFIRKTMSRGFKFVFERYFDLRLIDPSCPFFITSIDNLKESWQLLILEF